MIASRHPSAVWCVRALVCDELLVIKDVRTKTGLDGNDKIDSLSVQRDCCGGIVEVGGILEGILRL